VQTTYTNESEGYQFGDEIIKLSDMYDPSVMNEDGTPNMGAIYRLMQGDLGVCRSKVYAGEGKPVGWYFEKRERYEDTGSVYLRGAWVTVGKHVPTVAEHVEF
jgi:hypothetical protein